MFTVDARSVPLLGPYVRDNITANCSFTEYPFNTMNHALRMFVILTLAICIVDVSTIVHLCESVNVVVEKEEKSTSIRCQ